MTQTEQLERSMSPEELAGVLNVPPTVVYRQCRRFQGSRGATGLPCHYIDKAYLIPFESFGTWIKGVRR